MGAWVALHSASEVGEYSAMVLISPWVDPAEDIHELATGLPPTLILHGTADDMVPIRVARDIGAAMEDARVPVEFAEFEGGNHQWAGNQGDEGFEKLVKFLRVHLSPPD